jgi:hypothetical protein
MRRGVYGEEWGIRGRGKEGPKVGRGMREIGGGRTEGRGASRWGHFYDMVAHYDKVLKPTR